MKAALNTTKFIVSADPGNGVSANLHLDFAIFKEEFGKEIQGCFAEDLGGKFMGRMSPVGILHLLELLLDSQLEALTLEDNVVLRMFSRQYAPEIKASTGRAIKKVRKKT